MKLFRSRIVHRPWRTSLYLWSSQRLSQFRSTSWTDKGKYTGVKLLHVLNLACAIHLFSEYIGSISTMTGPSMLPTLSYEGELVIENRLSLKLDPENLSRGDLVVLRSPIAPNRVICKRILGLPGDVVCVDPTGQLAPSTEHVIVPEGHVWIVGDNAAFSRDSRDYGPVSMSLIQSKVFAKIWPITKATIYRNPSTFVD